MWSEPNPLKQFASRNKHENDTAGVGALFIFQFYMSLAQGYSRRALNEE